MKAIAAIATGKIQSFAEHFSMAVGAPGLHSAATLLQICIRYIYTRMRYSFDPAKNAENLRKHGVSLADGDGVLNDPLALTVADDAATGEPRWVTIGANYLGASMVVVWTPRRDEIRIISVRRAEPRERRAYEEGL